MSLLLRVNAAFAIGSMLAAAAAGLVCHSILEAKAGRDLATRAGLMLDSAVAIRSYTSNEIEPLLDERLKTEFLPQSVPFYAATQNFLRLREKSPQYSYKEATLNPTNPRDRAADWEADIVQRFRNDDTVQQLTGVRDTPMGPSFYMARPIRAEPQCLGCHSSPSAAPASLIARYGFNNGFGWQAHEVVGAQVVSVPFSSADVGLGGLFGSLMLVIAMVIGALWLILNAVLYQQCTRPLRRIARIADTLSLGEPCADEFPQKGAREITGLGASFDRMRNSLDKALKMLGS
ncbi:MAG: DUF3365 domain-containing protein [Steroidobacteraceae bacterium]|jgi:protein-histidine pros-kinase